MSLRLGSALGWIPEPVVETQGSWLLLWAALEGEGLFRLYTCRITPEFMEMASNRGKEFLVTSPFNTSFPGYPEAGLKGPEEKKKIAFEFCMAWIQQEWLNLWCCTWTPSCV